MSIKHQQNQPGHQVNLPNGLRELMIDITREVLNEQPQQIPGFIADYLDALLVIRENTFIAKHALDDLIQFILDMAELMKMSGHGLSREKAKAAANYLRSELKQCIDSQCASGFNETLIATRLTSRYGLERQMSWKLEQIINASFKGYFCRFISYHDAKQGIFGVTWKEAIKKTLNVYGKAQPPRKDLSASATVIQRAFRRFNSRNKCDKDKVKAVLVIQKHFRGYDTRRRLSETSTKLADAGYTITEVRNKSGFDPLVLFDDVINESLVNLIK